MKILVIFGSVIGVLGSRVLLGPLLLLLVLLIMLVLLLRPLFLFGIPDFFAAETTPFFLSGISSIVIRAAICFAIMGAPYIDLGEVIPIKGLSLRV